MILSIKFIYSWREHLIESRNYLSDIKVFLIGLKELFDKGSKQHVKKTLSGHYYYATKKLIEDKLKEIEK